jgi:hypothetical protein
MIPAKNLTLSSSVCAEFHRLISDAGEPNSVIVATLTYLFPQGVGMMANGGDVASNLKKIGTELKFGLSVTTSPICNLPKSAYSQLNGIYINFVPSPESQIEVAHLDFHERNYKLHDEHGNDLIEMLSRQISESLLNPRKT